MAYETVQPGDNPPVVVDKKTVGSVQASVQANSLMESKDSTLNALDKDMGTAYLSNESGFLSYGWRQDVASAQSAAGTRHAVSIGPNGGLFVEDAYPEAVVAPPVRRITAGTTQLVAASTSDYIYILHILIATAGAVQVSFQEGVTVVWGPLDLGRGFEASGTMKNPVWKTTTTGVNFQITTSASVGVTCKVNYVYV